MLAWRAQVMVGLIVAIGLSGCLGGSGPEGPVEGPDGAGEGLPTAHGGPPRDPVTWEIDIEGAVFVDGTITIQVGDTVEWTNRDLGTHTVTADNGEFDSGPMLDGPIVGTFAFTFDDVGEYPYHCALHSAMDETITVVERWDGAS